MLSQRALGRGLFDSDYVRQLAAEHKRGDAEHGDRLWMLINLELWQRMFLEGEAPDAILDEALFNPSLGVAA